MAELNRVAWGRDALPKQPVGTQQWVHAGYGDSMDIMYLINLNKLAWISGHPPGMQSISLENQGLSIYEGCQYEPETNKIENRQK